MKAKKLCIGMVGSVVLWGATVSQVSAQSSEPEGVQSLEDLKKLQSKIQEVVKKVRPATVGLTSSRGGSGSGVIVNKEGLILSAAHVVQGNEEMNVIFSDGKVYIAKVLGSNRTTDAAMLQLVKQKEWPFAEIGDSDSMDIGQYVIAMGHAGGYDTRRPAPVRFGRLLSKNRRGFITSDSVLIGGDSGGPLYDLDGKVVGINSSIGQSWQSNNHAGISRLVKDWDRLKEGDTWGALNDNSMDLDSPVMGFTFEELRNKGVVVTEVLDGSPAQKSGFKIGDVLTAVDNEKVKNGRDLLVAMNHHKPNDEVVVTLLRESKALKYKVKLIRRGELFKR